MREHVPQQTRIHYVITNGGLAPNVVPDFAEVYYYVRHPEATVVNEIWARLEEAARGAARGTGTQVEWEIIHGTHSLIVNETLATMMDEKLREVGGIEYTAEEQSFAEELYATLDSPSFKVGSQESIQPYEVSLGYASTDVGDVLFRSSMLLTNRSWPGTSTMLTSPPLGRASQANPRSMVIPRSFSSMRRSGSIPVRAWTRVDLP